MGTYGTFSNRPLYGGARRREAFTVLVKNVFSADCITKSTPTSTTNLPLDFLLCQVFHSYHLIPSLHRLSSIKLSEKIRDRALVVSFWINVSIGQFWFQISDELVKFWLTSGWKNMHFSNHSKGINEPWRLHLRHFITLGSLYFSHKLRCESLALSA